MRLEGENPILLPLLDELNRSMELIATVPEHLYRGAGDAKGSIGAHIRHNLDFVGALVNGVSVGAVDYADRERDPRVEEDQPYASWKVGEAIRSVSGCARVDPGTLLAVRSEVLPDVLHRSSFSREVEFVYSHMVHHHALINERLKKCGIALPTGLGIATSTQAHWDSLKLAA